MAALKHLLINSNFHQKSPSFSSSSLQFSSNNRVILSTSNENSFKANKITYCSKYRRTIYLPRAESRKDGIVSVEDDDDGVSLGTLKLPGNTDVSRFETLLFQGEKKQNQRWHIELESYFCNSGEIASAKVQMFPFPCLSRLAPFFHFNQITNLSSTIKVVKMINMKVDKVQGGVRLGFTEVDQGKTEVVVYIDCIVCPETDGIGPVFRAIRNGPSKAQAPPGEPRIMQSLLQALQKAVQIARL